MGADGEVWAERARLAWEQLLATSARRRRGRVQVLDGPGGRRGLAFLWPVSQVLAAALDVSDLPSSAPRPDGATTARGSDRRAGGDGVTAGAVERPDGRQYERAGRMVEELGVELERYRAGDGYATRPGARERYHDDNAWIGLDAVRAAIHADDQATAARWWEVARRAAGFVLAGQSPDGGIRWVEPRRGQASPLNACSTAPGIALALRVLRSHPSLTAEEAAALGTAIGRADAWLWSTLRSPEGLLWDRQEPDGSIDRTIWSYNQGAAVGADVAWWELDGAPDHLARARATATAALAWFAKDDRLWRQPPAFVAIFLRELIGLHEVAPRLDLPLVLDDYVQRAWVEGRDPATGRFTAGGIGAYGDGDGGTLDHAAIVQLLALRAQLAG